MRGIIFHAIGKFLEDSVSGLEMVDRWQSYVQEGSAPENDLQHSLSTVLLAILVLELLDEQPSDIEYDRYKVLACAALHDLGEINVGDTLYKKKNHDSFSLEQESFSQQIRALPERLRASLHDIYMIQYHNISSEPKFLNAESNIQMGSGTIFEFVERTGYLIYAIGEYDKSDKNIGLLVQVIRNQLGHIKKLLEFIPVGRRIYTNSLLSWMERIEIENRGKYLEE